MQVLLQGTNAKLISIQSCIDLVFDSGRLILSFLIKLQILRSSNDV